MNAPPRVSVIIVSYDVRELLRRCLATVAVQRDVEVEVWVVDNASRDGSAEMVSTSFPKVRLVRNAENVGFARANNQALAQATGDPLLLLNPDTELPGGALATLVEILRRHPAAGAAGLALGNPEGSAQPSCHAFPGVINLALESLALHRIALRFGVGTPTAAAVPRGGEGAVDWVHGACLAMTREAYLRVGGLDAGRFMYGEEMDWSWRARRLGFATVFSDAATVLHHGGASGGGVRGALFVRTMEARVEFLKRHRGAWRAAIAREILSLGSLLRLAYWVPRAALESRRGGVRPETRDQVERFRAVMAWRGGRAA